MPAARKRDLYREHKHEYVTPREPVLINIKPAKYLAVTGKGAPASAEFQNAVGALYGVAFTIKMAKKFAGQDYRVCHLEGLWWGTQETGDFSAQPPETWNWKLLIRVPPFIKEADLKAAIKQLKDRGRWNSTSNVKLETIKESKCVQMLHVGPYGEEGKTIRQMMEYARGQGLFFSGRHREIYLSDPRRVPATSLRTILRHAVR